MNCATSRLSTVMAGSPTGVMTRSVCFYPFNSIPQAETPYTRQATRLALSSICVKQTGSLKVRPGEVRPAEVRPAEDRPAEVSLAEIRPAEVRLARFAPPRYALLSSAPRRFAPLRFAPRGSPRRSPSR